MGEKIESYISVIRVELIPSPEPVPNPAVLSVRFQTPSSECIHHLSATASEELANALRATIEEYWDANLDPGSSD